MEHNYYAIYKNIKLRPLKKEDIELLRIWRNDTKATKFLRNIGYITPEMQNEWFNIYLKNDKEIIFAIEETSDLNRIVGSVSLYDIQNDIAEIGKIQIGDKDAHGRGIGRIALVMAMCIGFKKLNLEKVIAEVHQDNISAHKNDMKIGFKITGKRPSHVGGFEDEIEMSWDALHANNRYVDQVIIE